MRYKATHSPASSRPPAANPAVKYDTVYADADLVVIGKPAGLVTQPGLGHQKDTLLNGLFANYGRQLHQLGPRRDWGLLHRLDRQTSGLLVVALCPEVYDALRQDFQQRRLDKIYLAIVAGRPDPAQGVVQARLKEIHAGIKKVIISRTGELAVSAYRVLSATATAALVEVRIKTGRLHQIRAHMMFLGTPVCGEDIYIPESLSAEKLPRTPRLCLHAWKLGFQHPSEKQWREFILPPPTDFLAVLHRLALNLPGQ
ncbi:MAG: RluA family pseudouridine synthase [Planctomycetia bacterium]|nr:RluA family pseudouridine synthase [Planctomycetia bacterium]